MSFHFSCEFIEAMFKHLIMHKVILIVLVYTTYRNVQKFMVSLLVRD